MSSRITMPHENGLIISWNPYCPYAFCGTLRRISKR